MSDIYARSRYNAPPIAAGMARQTAPTEAFIHHTVNRNSHAVNTKREQEAVIRHIDAQHRAQGYAMFGYHWIVFQRVGTRDFGRGYSVRPAYYVPSAQKFHNTRTLAIAVYGDGRYDELLPDTISTIRKILRRYKRIRTLGAHGDVFATECPGPKFRKEIPRICSMVDGVRPR